MDRPDIEKISGNISESEKAAIKNISSDNLKKRVADMDLKVVADAMRRMNLGEAAAKLENMTNDDIINQISKNPEIIDKMKKIFK